MKLLVTGLCFQGNLGGPAIALSLADQLSSVITDLELKFAVPAGDELLHEREAARRHGFEVVPTTSFRARLPHKALKTVLEFQIVYFSSTSTNKK